MSTFQPTRDYLEAVSEDISRQLDSRGMTTTGTAKNSLAVVQGRSTKTGRFESKFWLISVDYVPLLYTGVGVKPDSIPPWQPGSELYKWVVNKGLSFTKENGQLMTRRQMSFLIARKITNEGTRIYRGRKGIDIEQILKARSSQYLEEQAQSFTADIIEDWNKAILAQ